jgi:hypothetical protein
MLLGLAAGAIIDATVLARRETGPVIVPTAGGTFQAKP